MPSTVLAGCTGASTHAAASTSTARLSKASTTGLQDEGNLSSVGALLVGQLHLELSGLNLVQDTVSGHAEQAVWPADSEIECQTHIVCIGTLFKTI